DELQNEFPNKKWIRYGEKSELGPKNIEVSSRGSSFVLNGETFKTNIIGKHNILNISSCLLYLMEEGFKTSELQSACAKLKMVKRRQEVRGSYKGSIVIDDFAHHPKAVTLTIDAIRSTFPDREIITIFEPISATARSSLFQNEFTTSLALSDKLIMAENSLKTTVQEGKNL